MRRNQNVKYDLIKMLYQKNRSGVILNRNAFERNINENEKKKIYIFDEKIKNLTFYHLLHLILLNKKREKETVAQNNFIHHPQSGKE